MGLEFIRRIRARTSRWGSRKRFAGKAAVIFLSRALALGLAAVGSIWSARCLGPHNLGLSSMVYALVTQTAVLLNLIHPTLLIRDYKNSKSAKKRNRLIQISGTFSLCLSAVFGLLGVGLQAFGLIPHEYHFAGWFFAPLLVLVTFQPNWAFQASEHQHFQSLIALIQPVLAGLLYLVFFRPGMSAGADLAVNTFVTLVVTLIAWVALYRLLHFRGLPFSLRDARYFTGFIRRSRWFFLSAFCVYVYTMLEQPLLGWLYSVEELGQYRTAIRVMNVVGSMLVVTGSLMFPRFLEWRKRGEEILWARQVRMGYLFAGLVVAGALVSFTLFPMVYPLAFGEIFVRAAIPAALLVTSKLMMLLTGVFVWGLRTDHRYDKSVSLFYILVACFSLGLNLVLIPRFGMFATASVNLASQSILFVFFFLMAFRRIGLIRRGKA